MFALKRSISLSQINGASTSRRTLPTKSAGKRHS
jgi:hypothetical protein